MYSIFKIYDSENEEIKNYTIREISKEKEIQMENLEKEIQSVVKKSNGPLWLRIIEYIAFFVGIILICSAINAYSKIQETTNIIRIILIIGIAIFLLGIFVLFYLRNRNKKISNNPSTLDLVNKVNQSIKDTYLELNVPSDAISLDILFIPTKITKGGEKHVKSLYTHMNNELKVFVEDDNLCFADNYRVIALKLSSFKKIVKINKNIVVPFWNKEKSFKDAEYKEYKIRTNGNGLIFIKPYYSIKHELNNVEYEILIPNYELNNFLKLIPLDIVEEIK